jgi:hypothetical protein
MFPSIHSIFRVNSSTRGVYSLILADHLIGFIVYLEFANQCLSWEKKCLEHLSPSIIVTCVFRKPSDSLVYENSFTNPIFILI